MKIALLVMPFLTPQLPSLGLAQIRSRLREVHGDAVEVHIRYVNLDFYRWFGHDRYLKFHSDATYTFVHDWLFRNEAFDDVPDNADGYLNRFYPGAANEEFRSAVLSLRTGLGALIDELIGEHRLDSYAVVGINATFSTVAGLAFARHLKRRDDRIVTVMGGASVYKEMGLALSLYYPHLDYVCSGPGLVSFPRLIGALMSGTGADSINGVFTKRNAGSVGIISDELDINHDIDLDYDDFYRRFAECGLDAVLKPRVLMETSRGCYWRRCRFCGLNEDQLKYRVKTPDAVIREIRRYAERYPYDIEMVDNVMPRQIATKVAPHIRIPRGREITYEIRSDFTEPEVRSLGEAGITRLQPGIETFSSDVHRLMDKGVDAFQCIAMLKRCVAHGILSGWNLMIGFPGMTEAMYEAILAAIPRLVHLLPPIVVTPVRFDRYSYYWSDRKRYDLDLRPFSPYRYIYPYDDDFLENFAYYFEDGNYGSPRVKLLVRYFGPLQKRVDEWKRRWESLDVDAIPKLYRRTESGESFIVDSRGAHVEEHRLDGMRGRVMQLLEQPQTVETIVGALPGATADEVRSTLESFDAAGLVFSEGDRRIGLAVNGYSDERLARICGGLQRSGRLFQKYIKV